MTQRQRLAAAPSKTPPPARRMVHRRVRRRYMKRNTVRTADSVVLALAAFLLLCGVATAQNDKLNGVINGRSGATMSLQTQGSENVTVVLTPDTQVLEPEGAFRKKH